MVISIREREITLKIDEWSEKALKGLLFTNCVVTNCVIQSKVGKMFFRNLLGESLLALFFQFILGHVVIFMHHRRVIAYILFYFCKMQDRF